MTANITPFKYLPSMVVLRHAPTLEDFEAPLTELLYYQRNILWWIGDMIVAAETKYGDDYHQVIPLDVSDGLLDRCRAVAIAFPRTERNINLSWTHHYECVRATTQDKRLLLKQAEEQGWTSGELRKQVSALKSGRSKANSSAGFQEWLNDHEDGKDHGGCKRHTSEQVEEQPSDSTTDEQ